MDLNDFEMLTRVTEAIKNDQMLNQLLMVIDLFDYVHLTPVFTE